MDYETPPSPVDYLRISVTDRCLFRCVYCMPAEGVPPLHHEDILRYEEILRVVRVAVRLGVSKVRVTGGEPLVRKGVVPFIGRLAAVEGVRDVGLTTNGALLESFAAPLREAGLRRVNVSLDTLRPDLFKEITRWGGLGEVLAGLDAAQRAGLKIKLNMVALKGVNEGEIEDVLAWAHGRGVDLTLIETMPMGDTGRGASDHYLDLQTVKSSLTKRFNLIPTIDGSVDSNLIQGGGPARYLRVAGTDTHVGFITPISQHFCATCNRVRLSVDGTLYMCLGQEDAAVGVQNLQRGSDGLTLKFKIHKTVRQVENNR